MFKSTTYINIKINKYNFVTHVCYKYYFQEFLNDQTIDDLVTKKIKQSIDNIRPSLTSEQSDILTSEQQNFNKDLDNVLNSAKIIQEQLGEEYNLLKEYKTVVDKVSSILESYKFNEEPVQNIAGLYFNIEKITLVQKNLLVSIESFFYLFYNYMNDVFFSASTKRTEFIEK